MAHLHVSPFCIGLVPSYKENYNCIMKDATQATEKFNQCKAKKRKEDKRDSRERERERES